jgi:hypothetical protein
MRRSDVRAISKFRPAQQYPSHVTGNSSVRSIRSRHCTSQLAEAIEVCPKVGFFGSFLAFGFGQI